MMGAYKFNCATQLDGQVLTVHATMNLVDFYKFMGMMAIYEKILLVIEPEPAEPAHPTSVEALKTETE